MGLDDVGHAVAVGVPELVETHVRRVRQARFAIHIGVIHRPEKRAHGAAGIDAGRAMTQMMVGIEMGIGVDIAGARPAASDVAMADGKGSAGHTVCGDLAALIAPQDAVGYGQRGGIVHPQAVALVVGQRAEQHHAGHGAREGDGRPGHAAPPGGLRPLRDQRMGHMGLAPDQPDARGIGGRDVGHQGRVADHAVAVAQPQGAAFTRLIFPEDQRPAPVGGVEEGRIDKELDGGAVAIHGSAVVACRIVRKLSAKDTQGGAVREDGAAIPTVGPVVLEARIGGPHHRILQAQGPPVESAVG